MRNNYWTVFRETGEPMCYILCKAEEQRLPAPEIISIPEEFKMNPPAQPEPISPR